MTHTVEEIELMDKIFNHYFFDKEKHKNLTERFYSNLFKTEIGLIKFAKNEMLRILDQMDIVTAQKFQSGDYELVTGEKYKLENFKNQGGFKKLYFDQIQKDESEKKRQLLSDEKLTAELDIVKFQIGLGKKLTIWGVAISAITIVVSILTTVVTEHKKDNQTLPFDTLSLKTQLQNIETRIKTLESKQVKDTPTKK